MDDRSRELEREIAQAKPAPFKRSRESKIIIVDDFGEMKSGNWFEFDHPLESCPPVLHQFSHLKGFSIFRIFSKHGV